MKPKLPPHGYEGMRALRPQLPRPVTPTDTPLPPLGEGVEFQPLTPTDPAPPVRLLLDGQCVGIFARRELAGPILRQRG